MRKDKQEAFRLRMQSKSYKQIMARLNVPKATLSDWFSKLPWSNELSDTLNEKNKKANKARFVELSKIRGENLDKIYNQARKEAAEEFDLLKHHPLFVSGVIIYWTEGDKISPSFRVTNTDPLMIKLFVRFLLEICRMPKNKIRINLLLYPDLNPDSCISYWSKETGLDSEHFAKSTVIQGRHKTRKLQYGICILYLPSRFLKEKMLIWMNLLPKYLVQ